MPRVADRAVASRRKGDPGPRLHLHRWRGVNAVDAWLGSLPGHAYANVRQPPVSTLNLAHMLPLSAVWAGPADRRALRCSRRCSSAGPRGRRRSASRFMSAMSAIRSWSARRAPASPCCWPLWRCSSGATRQVRRSSPSTSAVQHPCRCAR